MFPTSRFLIIVSCLALVAGTSASGCSENSPAQTVGNSQADAPLAGENGAGGAITDANASDAGSSSGGIAGDPSNTDDYSYAGSSDENGKCRHGQTRCHGDLGFQRCTPDGVWGLSQSCGGYSENGTSSYCAVVDDGGGPWAACIDPACWWWLKNGVKLGDGRAGVCVGDDQVRPCQASSLSRPEPCTGLCRRVGEIDGRVLGYCDDACVDGEFECLTGPLYRACVNGRWSTTPLACDNGEVCQPLGLGAHSDIQCGGDCVPGTSHCGDDGMSVSRCGDDGQWEAASACTHGRCVHEGAQAQCQTECKPGEHACAVDGAPSEVVCDERGLWGAPTACAEGELCRIGSAGALGCLACVGPQVVGGNVWGVADARCEGDALVECGPENQPASGAACDTGQTCVEVKRGAASLAYCK